MMAPRLRQNFSGCRALIITASRGATTALDVTLAKLGVTSEYPRFAGGQPELPPLNADSDILFVDGDLEQTVNIEPDPVSHLPPVPVIGLVGVEAPSRLAALTNLGATSFLRKPVHGATVYTSLFLGINQFLLRTQMSERFKDMELKRRGRRTLIKAIVAVMNQGGVSDDEAYAVLRRESMRSRQSIEQYCEDFLNRGATASKTLGVRNSVELRSRRN